MLKKGEKGGGGGLAPPPPPILVDMIFEQKNTKKEKITETPRFS